MKASELVKILSEIVKDFDGEDVIIRTLNLNEEGEIRIEVVSNTPPKNLDEGVISINDRTGALN